MATNLGGTRAVRGLLAHVRPHWRRLAVGALVSAVGGTAALATPMLAKEFVDRLGSGRPVTGLVVTLGVIVLTGAIVAAVGRYLIDRTAERIVRDVRSSLLHRLLRLRVDVVDRIPPGDLLARVTADSTLLRHASTNDLVDLVIGVIVLLGMVGFMAHLDLTLLGVVIAVLLVIGGAAVLVVPRIGTATSRAQEALGEVGGYLERALGALRTIKANGAERRESAVLDEAVDRAYRQGVAAAGWSAVAGASGGLVLQISFLAVFGVGGARVANGSLPVSSLIAFLMYLFYLYSPINQLIQGISGLQVGLAAVRRIDQVADLPVEGGESEPARVTEPAQVTEPAGGRVAVAFRGVSFRYAADGPPVLDCLDFEVPTGGMTALVGPSGAGKSTIFALIERFHQADAGVVEFAGRDVRQIPLTQLRAAIGYVEQDAPVLSGTLRDNLRFAAPDATDRDIDEVVGRTRLDEVVGRLPAGLDTRVGHRGATLSGGERQRVAIARALLRRPRVLLLDEATSALDGLNELSLRDVIAEVARDSTVLVIAHRLSTVAMARRILLLDGGRIRATGTHHQLFEGDDLYRTLATTQLLEPEVEPVAEPVAAR